MPRPPRTRAGLVGQVRSLQAMLSKERGQVSGMRLALSAIEDRASTQGSLTLAEVRYFIEDQLGKDWRGAKVGTQEAGPCASS